MDFCKRPHGLLAAWALTTTLGSAWAQPRPQTWVVAVGVDKYSVPSVGDLRYAGADAKLVAQSFRDLGKVPESNIFAFTSDSIEPELSPRATNIMARIGWLKGHCRAEDTLVFFFAGHGVTMDQGYLLTEEADNRSVETLRVSSLRSNELFTQLAGFPTSKILFIFDACRNTVAPESNAASESYQAFSLSKGSKEYATLFSCDVGERSWEWEEKRHGFFTYYLAEGLRSGAVSSDAKVSLQSLTHYLGESVPLSVSTNLKRSQNPILHYQGKGAERWVLAESVSAAGPRTPQDVGGLVAQLDLARAQSEKAEAEKKLVQDELLLKSTEIKKMVARLEILERRSEGMAAPAAEVVRRDLANENVRQLQKRRVVSEDAIELLEAEKEELKAQNAALQARIRLLELKLGQQERGQGREVLLASDFTLQNYARQESSEVDPLLKLRAAVERLKREQALVLSDVSALAQAMEPRLPISQDDPVVLFLTAQLEIYAESTRTIQSQLETARKALLARDAQLASAQAAVKLAQAELRRNQAELAEARRQVDKLEADQQKQAEELLQERQRGDQLLAQLRALEERTQRRFQGIAIDSQWNRICRLVKAADITYVEPKPDEPDAQSLTPRRKD
ncbi:caspase family protein [bacterium]|nr:caspase family protein [bacterium]